MKQYLNFTTTTTTTTTTIIIIIIIIIIINISAGMLAGLAPNKRASGIAKTCGYLELFIDIKFFINFYYYYYYFSGHAQRSGAQQKSLRHSKDMRL
jgi:hypothetical protein